MWSDFFDIRYDFAHGYYFAMKGEYKNAFPHNYFRHPDNAKQWIKDRYRDKLNDIFEQAVLK